MSQNLESILAAATSRRTASTDRSPAIGCKQRATGRWPTPSGNLGSGAANQSRGCCPLVWGQALARIM